MYVMVRVISLLLYSLLLYSMYLDYTILKTKFAVFNA